MYTMHASASNNSTPSYTHVHSYMVWRLRPQAFIEQLYICDHGHFRISRMVHGNNLNYVKVVFASLGHEMCLETYNTVCHGKHV